ncbi:MFS transporter [Nonomuraea sp. SYSU D8015]|uniref:MFS transporter n=1 Tax=Nonomuraea sp. SYSU D8015 TaxID=2593644 RepID=UPI001CB71C0E|nr:MFS transporter [Nonomuraea sp. SYSU D8015]
MARTFLTWSFLRAVCHRGYVLTSGLYFVLVARLSAAEILLLGTVMAVTMLVSDIPIGMCSDAVSRKWALVAGHAFLAAGMVMTGLVTSFPWIAATQALWGLGWACLAGADVAWLTDELDEPGRTARVLTAGARWDLAGRAAGMIAFGGLGWAAGLATAIVVSGAGMAVLGLYVATVFTEHGVTPARTRRLRTSLSIFGRGLGLARRDNEILLALAATTVVNGAVMISWLFPRQLIALGFPGDPTLWYAALGIVSSAAGAAALRLVQSRIDGPGAARRIYVLACLLGPAGLAALAYAPGALAGGLGVLLVSGIADPLVRVVSVIWVNRRVTSDVRATVQSFLSQAETVGKILGGFALAALAQAAGARATLLAAGALIVLAGALAARSRAGR